MAGPIPGLEQHLPREQVSYLRSALGHKCTDMERRLWIPKRMFVETMGELAADYFGLCTGSAVFYFDNGVSHVLTAWEPQLSVLVGEPLPPPPPEATLVRLTSEADAPASLRTLIGSVCLDVRIWTMDDGSGGTEAMQCGLSYVFDQGEVFYCTYLHGRFDDACLVLRSEISLAQVRECFSVARNEVVTP